MPTPCLVCRKGLADFSSRRRHMVGYHPNHPNTVEVYGNSSAPTPEPTPEPLPEPEPFHIVLPPLNVKIIEPEEELPSWKRRQVEAEERAIEDCSMVEELQRICADSMYESRGLEIRWVEGKEYCLFATMPFAFGSPVCEYKGTYISRKEAESVEQSYVFDFNHENRAVSIDATKHEGTVGRYIAHDRDSPNVIPQKVDCIGDGRPHLIFFTYRDISVEDEVVYEYGDFSQRSSDDFPWLGKPYLKPISKVWSNKPY